MYSKVNPLKHGIKLITVNIITTSLLNKIKKERTTFYLLPLTNQLNCSTNCPLSILTNLTELCTGNRHFNRENNEVDETRAGGLSGYIYRRLLVHQPAWHQCPWSRYPFI